MTGGLQRDGARYKIGPLTTYVDPNELRQWHLRARAGEDLVYAIGPALGAGSPTPKVARELAESGVAMLSQRREAGGIHYVIRKRECRAAGQAPPVAPRWQGKPEGRVLDAVTELAVSGLPLPTYDVLAEACQLADGEAVRYRLGVLAKAGVVQLSGDAGARIVEICGTGLRTADGRRR